MTRILIVFLSICLSSCAKDDRKWVETRFPNVKLQKIFWANNQFVTFGVDSKNYLVYLTSPDGNSWIQKDTTILIGNMDARSIYYENSKILFDHSDAGKNSISYSSDFVSWTEVTPDIRPGCNIIFDGYKYLTCDNLINFNDCVNVTTSQNMISWQLNPVQNDEWCFSQIFYLNKKYFAYIFFKYDYNSRGILISDNSITWKELELFRGRYVGPMEYADNQYILVGNLGGIYTSPDGEIWTDHSMFMGPSFGQVVRGNNEYIFFPGTDNQEIWSTPDFRSWKQYIYKKAPDFPNLSGFTGYLNDMATDGTTTVIVGEEHWWDNDPDPNYGVILTSQ